MAQSIATSGEAPGAKEALLAGLKSATGRMSRKVVTSLEDVRDRFDTRIDTEIDIEKVIRLLDAETRGRADGEAGQPPPSEESASGTQREVVAHFRSLQRRAQRKAVSAAEKLRELAAGIDIAETVAEIRDLPARCENDMIRLTAKLRPQIERAQQETFRAIADADELDEADATGVDAKRGSALGYSLLSVLLIVTSAFMVSNLATSGVVQAPATWAFAVTALAVIAPFVITREVLHHANMHRQPHRVMAAAGIALSVVFVVVLAVVVAAMVSMVIGGGNPDIQSVLNAFASPTAGLAVVAEGWISAAIVVVAGMLAVGLGQRSVEADARQLPAGVTRDVRHQAAPENSGVQLSERYNRLIDRADKDLNTKVSGVRKRIRQYARMVDHAEMIPAALSDYDVVLEDACNIVLDRYRAANRAVRDVDEPPSFSAHVCFRQDNAPHAKTFEHAAATGNELQESLKKLDSEVAKSRQLLRNLNRRSLASADGASLSPESGYGPGELV